MTSITEMFDCIGELALAQQRRHGRRPTDIVATRKVPSGLAVSPHGDPRRIYVNTDDARRLSFCHIDATVLGMRVRWSVE